MPHGGPGKGPAVDRVAVTEWVAGYERLWRRPGTDGLDELFTSDVAYVHSPYERPIVGLAALAADWEAQREGPNESFTLGAEVVAVEGTTAVVRAEVRYGDPVRQEYRDLWVLEFAPDGRCRRFEEWPFWPGRDWAASVGG